MVYFIVQEVFDVDCFLYFRIAKRRLRVGGEGEGGPYLVSEWL